MALKVMVFDEGPISSRPQASADALVSAGAETYLWDKGLRCKAGPEWDTVTFPREVDLLLLHNKNESRWEKEKESDPKIVIRYSGKPVPDENGFWLQGTDQVDTDCAYSIVTWAAAYLAGDTGHDLPYCLRPFCAAHFLSALSILCQGYLAVHTNSMGLPEDVEPKEEAVVRQALEKMGWMKALTMDQTRSLLPEALRDDSDNGPSKRQALRVSVRSGDFWSPLVTEAKAGEPSPISDAASVKSTEWDVLSGRHENATESGWHPVEKLLELLKDNKTPGARAGVVAKAYIELAARIGGS